MALVSSNAVSSEAVGHKEYVGRFVAITNDIADGPAIAEQTVSQNALSGIPDRYSTYAFGNETDAGSHAGRPVATLRGDSTDNRKVWDVTVVYSPHPTTVEDNDYDDPLLKPVQWSGIFGKHQAIAEKDTNGNAIANAAGDAFDPPALKDDSRPIIRAVKNYASFDLSQWMLYRDAINSGTFLNVYPAGTVKVQQISWRELFRASAVPYIEATFEFEINPDGWDVKLLNQGFNVVVDGEKKRATDKDGRDIASPVLLDSGATNANGNLDVSALTPAQVQAGNATFLSFDVYVKRSFGLLGLPSTPVKS